MSTNKNANKDLKNLKPAIKKVGEFEKQLTKLPEVHYEGECQCYICRMGIDAAMEREREMLESYGWFAHYVQDDCDCPNHINYHTHGLKEFFNHIDFQITVSLRPVTAQLLFSMLVDEISNGKTFEAGKDYEGLLQDNYALRFINATECGRNVLRVLVCGIDGTYDKSPFKEQFTMLNHEA